MNAHARNGSAADYPYDPLCVPEMQRGLDKLRAVKDRRLAQQLYELYFLCEKNERRPEVIRRIEQFEKKKRETETEALRETATAALAGAYGQQAEEIARTMLQDDRSGRMREDLDSLKAFLAELQRIPQSDRYRREPLQRSKR